ncbi:alpha/beta hydrolase [Methylocaldum szegediense]|uniref:AB hydrolase-1 domain-containing protein n=1 Tax=Methylocaldum szegediense TaxID=73780 RepID=A0ABM9HWM1_9GAMM|nr:alpha/beta fold hydrolase [Methylocaldum szegediense]CAI8732807.1 AB hydrolase-1 domain-containing protein [Methylocaldum szegediense]
MAYLTNLCLRWLGISAVLFLCICPITFAKWVDESTYGYPYKNAYTATATVAILKDCEQRYVWEESQDLELELIPGRNEVPLLEGKGKLRVRYSPYPGPSPLVFVLPGFGGSAYSGAVRYLAQLLTDHGFQVLSLPSPFHWNFTLAASRSALPGLTERDSEDMYRAMQAALNAVRERFHPEITRIGLVGLSHGALTAAFVRKFDLERKEIGFDATLMINPPIDLLGAIRTIEQLANLEKLYTEQQRSSIQSYAIGTGRAALSRSIEDPGYFADWDRRLQLDDEQIRYLIGWTLRQPVGSSLYVSSLVNPSMGFLQTPISWGYRSARLEEARSYSLMAYLEKVLVPHLERRKQTLSFEELVRASSLKSIAPTLGNDPTVYLMHNADDFLVSEEDLRSIERIFGDRAIIYPHGGHLGNLWYTQNRRDILAILNALLRDPADARRTTNGASMSVVP